MSKAALSDFLIKQAFMDASAKHLGLESVLHHGDTETSHPYVCGTLHAEIKPIVVKGSTPVVLQRSYGDQVTQMYAQRRAAAELAARQTPKP